MAQRSRTAIVALKLRLREDLRRQLASEAKKHGHSLNREILRRLERSFELEAKDELITEVRAIRGLLDAVPRPTVSTGGPRATLSTGGPPRRRESRLTRGGKR